MGWICATDSTCLHNSMWNGRNDPVCLCVCKCMCVCGSLKDKKPLCIISWGGGRERQKGWVLSWGRGQWPSSESFRWPNSQHIGILCRPPLCSLSCSPPCLCSTVLLASFPFSDYSTEQGWHSCLLTLSQSQHILYCQLCVGSFMPVLPTSYTVLKRLFFSFFTN